MFKTTNLIFCRFSHVNDNKMVLVTLKWLFKVINVIIIIQKLYFKNYTGKNGI